MSSNDIGGFFVSLGLKTDKNSFKSGVTAIDAVSAGFSKLIGIARNAAVVLATTAVASSKVASEEYRTAELIGISTSALDKWKAAASNAGVSSNGLIGSMGKLADIVHGLSFGGEGFEQYANQLSKLGIGAGELIDEFTNKITGEVDISGAFQRVFERAQEVIKSGEATSSEVYKAVKDITGEEGAKFLIEIERKGMSVGSYLEDANKSNYMNAQDHTNAAEFTSEIRELKTKTVSIMEKLGVEVGKELTPYLKKLTDFIDNNKEAIVNGIKSIADTVGQIAQFVAKLAGSDITKDIVGQAGTVLVGSAKTAGALLSGDVEGAKDAILESAKKSTEIRENAEKRIIQEQMKTKGSDGVAEVQKLFGKSKMYEGITEQEAFKMLQNAKSAIWGGTVKQQAKLALSKEDYEEFLKIVESSKKQDKENKNKKKVSDGIIRPSGDVVQVAPNDWVFAAQNISDMARAFFPQNASTNQVSIVQNFTLNGVQDMPARIRQTAFEGTQSAITQSMMNSSRRIQMMSGTR